MTEYRRNRKYMGVSGSSAGLSDGKSRPLHFVIATPTKVTYWVQDDEGRYLQYERAEFVAMYPEKRVSRVTDTVPVEGLQGRPNWSGFVIR